MILGFNSRSREGSDLSKVDGKFLPSVSIHAPVKGATGHGQELHAQRIVSIHAPVKGATKDEE